MEQTITGCNAIVEPKKNCALWNEMMAPVAAPTQR